MNNIERKLEQRRTIGEICGVQTKYFRFKIPYHNGLYIWRSKYKTYEEAALDHSREGRFVLSEVEEYTDLCYCPDYPYNLAAMNEAEETLSDDEFLVYEEIILDILTAKLPQKEVNGILIPWGRVREISASAGVRAEAFLKVKKMWK